jgi:hypothetical protein
VKFRRTSGIAGLSLACALVLVACSSGGSPVQTTGAPWASSSAAATGTGQATSQAGIGSGVIAGLPNRDARLLKLATPCTLVTSVDLHKLFNGSFTNVLGTEESPVTDLLETTRACGYESDNARIDHGNSYDITSVSISIKTSLDNKAGSLWQGRLDAIKLGTGKHATVPGATDAIKLGKGAGWYQVHKGQVIIEVTDNDGGLTDDAAQSILYVALKKLP